MLPLLEVVCPHRGTDLVRYGEYEAEERNAFQEQGKEAKEHVVYSSLRDPQGNLLVLHVLYLEERLVHFACKAERAVGS